MMTLLAFWALVVKILKYDFDQTDNYLDTSNQSFKSCQKCWRSNFTQIWSRTLSLNISETLKSNFGDQNAVFLRNFFKDEIHLKIF